MRAVQLCMAEKALKAGVCGVDWVGQVGRWAGGQGTAYLLEVQGRICGGAQGTFVVGEIRVGTCRPMSLA